MKQSAAEKKNVSYIHDFGLFLTDWNCFKNRLIQSLQNVAKAFLSPATQFLVVSAFICFYVIPSHAGLDAPHNSENGISCENCHDVNSILPQMMPAMTYTPEDIDDTPFNALCWSCHNNTIATIEDTHSSVQTDNDYGAWTVECRVCHNQHTQDQASACPRAPNYLIF